MLHVQHTVAFNFWVQALAQAAVRLSLGFLDLCRRILCLVNMCIYAITTLMSAYIEFAAVTTVPIARTVVIGIVAKAVAWAGGRSSNGRVSPAFVDERCEGSTVPKTATVQKHT